MEFGGFGGVGVRYRLSESKVGIGSCSARRGFAVVVDGMCVFIRVLGGGGVGRLKGLGFVFRFFGEF